MDRHLRRGRAHRLRRGCASVTSRRRAGCGRRRNATSRLRGDRGERAASSSSGDAGLERLQRHQPVERAAVEQVKAERLRDAGRDRALARGGRAVDGDHRDRTLMARASPHAERPAAGRSRPRTRRNSPGNVLRTQSGSLMRTATPPKRRERKAHRHPVIVVGVDRRRPQLARRMRRAGDRRPPRPSRRACAARSPSRRCDRSPSPASWRCRSASSGPRANSATTASVIAASGIATQSSVMPASARAARAPRSSRRRSGSSAPIRASTSANATSPWIESRPTPVDAHRTAADRARGEEIRRRRRVAFDVDRPGARVARAGRNAERAPAVAARRATPKRSIRLRRDRDVGLRDQLAARPRR